MGVGSPLFEMGLFAGIWYSEVWEEKEWEDKVCERERGHPSVRHE